MVNQTSSTLDQNTNKVSKHNKLKPVHFLLIFFIISIIFAFIIGGYFIGKSIQEKERQEAAVTLEEQVDLDPVSLPGNPENWTTYIFEPLNLEFKLPEELNKKATWKVNEITGDSGKTLCFSDENILDGNECMGETLVIVTTSSSYTSSANEPFLDSQGFEAVNEVYSVKSLTGESLELSDTIFKPYENNENFEILKIVGKENGLSGTPKEGYLGAIVNTNNSEYPAIVLRMNINGDISEYEFDQILESLQITN